ncbi:MAG: glycerophosphodiester phosphodiesterase family protein [Rhodothermales bacterium]
MRFIDVMRRPLLRIALLALVVGGSTSCATTATRTAPEAPSYTRTSEHYRAYASAAALAEAMRPDALPHPLISAHRGGFQRGFPENAIPSMERVLRLTPALFEIDIQLTEDSVLVLMHDYTVDRTTNGEGEVDDYTLAELRQLLLVDPYGVVTPFRVPTFAEVLAWSEARAVLTVDVKRGVPAEAVVSAIRAQNAENRAIVIVYSPEAFARYYALAPDLNYSLTISSEDALDELLATGADLSRVSAWTGVGEAKPTLIERLNALGISAAMGTFGLIDERATKAGSEVYDGYLGQGIDILATDTVPIAVEAVKRQHTRN